MRTIFKPKRNKTPLVTTSALFRSLGNTNKVLSMIKGKTSVDKLEELEFDPISALLEQLHDTEKLLQLELASKGRGIVITALINNRTKILESLLPYGYSKVPTQEAAPTSREPIRIIFAEESKDE